MRPALLSSKAGITVDAVPQGRSETTVEEQVDPRPRRSRL